MNHTANKIHIELSTLNRAGENAPLNFTTKTVYNDYVSGIDSISNSSFFAPKAANKEGFISSLGRLFHISLNIQNFF